MYFPQYDCMNKFKVLNSKNRLCVPKECFVNSKTMWIGLIMLLVKKWVFFLVVSASAELLELSVTAAQQF